MKQIWMVVVVMMVLSVQEGHSGVGSAMSKAGKAVVRVVTRGGRKALSESAEGAIRAACKTLGDDAVQLAAKYGDDMVKVLSRHGDTAVRLVQRHGDDVARMLMRHGDEVMRVAGKYGDAGVQCLARGGDEAVELMRKYGDEVLEVLIRQPGIGSSLVKMYGKESVAVARNVTEDGAAMLVKAGEHMKTKHVREVAEEIARSGRRLTGKEVLEIVTTKAPHLAAGLGIVMVASSARGSVEESMRKCSRAVHGTCIWG